MLGAARNTTHARTDRLMVYAETGAGRRELGGAPEERRRREEKVWGGGGLGRDRSRKEEVWGGEERRSREEEAGRC